MDTTVQPPPVDAASADAPWWWGVVLSTELATAYTAILLMAVTPIYIGSRLSLQQQVRVNDKGEVEYDDKTETMSSDDAWKFPFIGSGVLFGLYILFKVFSKEYVNMILTAYFALFGVFSIAETIKPILMLSRVKPKEFKTKFNIPYFAPKVEDPVKLEFDTLDVAGAIIGVLVFGWYTTNKHWVLNNIIGLAFSIQGIQRLSPGSYRVSAILLCGLFFYDIFWVFGTDVMVTVAKSFDAPIKLCFPKDVFAETLQFSMLGLGDIVIPGIFIALMLRFDHREVTKAAIEAAKTAGKGAVIHKTQPREIYFRVVFASYFVGLVLTMVVMHVFKAAQPALLYLVPAILISTFVTALVRGEVGALLAYDEAAEKDAREKQDPKKAQ
jgi:minor histocompatibility antigen H13